MLSNESANENNPRAQIMCALPSSAIQIHFCLETLRAFQVQLREEEYVMEIGTNKTTGVHCSMHEDFPFWKPTRGLCLVWGLGGGWGGGGWECVFIFFAEGLTAELSFSDCQEAARGLSGGENPAFERLRGPRPQAVSGDTLEECASLYQ